MQLKKANPMEVCLALLNRSQCAVQVSAVLADRHGIHAWGWNSMGGDGMGMHAELHALSRANRSRLADSTMWVCARRKRSGRPVLARPCSSCHPHLDGIKRVTYCDGDGIWRNLR